MKKIITICLIMAATFTANAQQKPTKEQTVKFIDRTLQMMTDWAGRTYKSVNFTEKELHTVESHKTDEGIIIKTDITYSGFLWETLILVQEMGDHLNLHFLKNPNYKREVDRDGVIKVTEKESLLTAIYLSDSEKRESLKKAFLRLSEIAKEENNDPFKN